LKTGRFGRFETERFETGRFETGRFVGIPLDYPPYLEMEGFRLHAALFWSVRASFFNLFGVMM
jgi:hypothetical protein